MAGNARPTELMEFDPRLDSPTNDEVTVQSRDFARDPLEIALSEYLSEIRQGMTPTIDEFTRRYPGQADQIRELFPLVSNLERWKSDKEIDCLRRNVPQKFSFDQLGEYRLVRELGRGGMGVVFEAEHAISHRPVAIKLLPWRFAADMPVWKERLHREATTIAALQHPNIVQIYSFSEDHGYYYYVMQFVDGVGLDKIIQQLKSQRKKSRSSRKSTRVTVAADLAYDAWRGFAKLGEQVASALAYAHHQGVLHNDIKPSNLLVRSNGHVIVTDFGIGQTQSGELSDDNELAIGTLRYMAPERLMSAADVRSDIYSLGVTLYELVTQQPLFDFQKRARLSEAILKQPPTNPRRLISDLPADLERVILKAICKSPIERYQSARAMAEDLRRFINRQPLKFANQGIWQRAATWGRRWLMSWRK